MAIKHASLVALFSALALTLSPIDSQAQPDEDENGEEEGDDDDDDDDDNAGDDDDDDDDDGR